MILDEIVANKRKELEEAKKSIPLEILQKAMAYAPSKSSLLAVLRSRDFSLIAEVKRASPSAGLIRNDFDPVPIAKAYQSAGAAALSVLTDRKYFQGDLDTLRTIKQTVTIPILRKDFLLDAYQIFESKIYGADALLLIVAILQKPLLQNLLELSQMMEMTALVEVHTEAEMEIALSTNAELIGINNRDLQTFQIDLETTPRLLSRFPEARQKIVVAESGIQTASDVQRVHEAGARAVLVGETLLKSDNIPQKIIELMGSL